MNLAKCFLFLFKSSFLSRENHILIYQIFKFHDGIKCLRIKQKYVSLNNLRSKHSLLMTFGQFLSYYKRKFYPKVLQKLRLKNQFQALFCLQRIKYNIYWKMKFLKQVTHIRYALAKLSKYSLKCVSHFMLRHLST